MYGAVQEPIGLRRVLQSLEVVPHVNPINHYDSMTPLIYVRDQKYHGKSKYMKLVITAFEIYLHKGRSC